MQLHYRPKMIQSTSSPFKNIVAARKTGKKKTKFPYHSVFIVFSSPDAAIINAEESVAHTHTRWRLMDGRIWYMEYFSLSTIVHSNFSELFLTLGYSNFSPLGEILVSSYLTDRSFSFGYIYIESKKQGAGSKKNAAWGVERRSFSVVRRNARMRQPIS